MVDVMAHHSQKEMLDVEDGELIEDGEICDDDEENAGDAKAKNGNAASSPRTESPPKRATTVAGAALSRRSEDSQHDPFAPRVPPAKKSAEDAVEGNGEYFGSGDEDKDYRVKEESYGDSDYRPMGRRRRYSPTHLDDPDFEPMRSKRPYPGPGGRGGFRGFRPKRNTEHQICKFFREGYCRDGDQCSYSHQAEDSLRRAELCKFYQTGFCKKGLNCLMLHGEFPCKAFHKGECGRDVCRFSHLPLTDYTRPLYEKMMAEEEMMPSRPPLQGFQPPQPPRRVLLPGGPRPPPPSGAIATPPHQAMMPPPGPVIHAPLPPQQNPNGQLAPPSIVVPTLAPPQMRPPPNVYQATGGFFNPPTIVPPTKKMEPPKLASSDAQPVFNLDDMLAKLAAGGSALDSGNVDESPASPPPLVFGHASTSFLAQTKTIPENRAVQWRVLPVRCKPTYSDVENSERIAANDPRKKRVLSSAFDAFTSLLTSTNGTEPMDPRIRSQYESTPAKPFSSTSAHFSSWMPQI